MNETVERVELDFDSSNPNWDSRETHSFMFLRSMELHMNDMLRARGHVTVNDVYDVLGFDRTEEGALSGWVKGEYIDFELVPQLGELPSTPKIFLNPTTNNVFRALGNKEI